MPVYGTAIAAKSNVVTDLPVLPVPMFLGTVSGSVQFQGFPSLSLEYQGVLEADLPRLESSYQLSRDITLYGTPYRVSSYSYQRDGYSIRNGIKFNVYQVSISCSWKYELVIEKEIKLKPLAGRSGKVAIAAIASAAKIPYSGPSFSVTVPDNADVNYSVTLKTAVEQNAKILGCYISYANGVTLRRMTSGGSWSFDDADIINDGQNNISEQPAYNNTLLEGGFLNSNQSNQTIVTSPATFTYVAPVTETVIEEDQDPNLLPVGTTVLRTLDSCFDLSGPKRVRKITTQMYDNPESEEIWTYGFVYTAADIRAPNDELLSTNPARFWKIIEYQKIQYIYKSIPSITLAVTATDPTNPSKTYPPVIHPDYDRFASIPRTGGNITFTTTASYLTEIKGTGWKVVRFAREGEKESTKYDTFDPVNTYYKACQFFTIPVESKTLYLLESARSHYGDTVGSPFSVEWVDYTNLDPKLKSRVSTLTHVNSQGQVAVLTPDINYAEPMLVLAESTAKSSFAYTADPTDTPEVPVEPLKTGEETYQHTSRKVISSNKYREKSTEYSAQDPGFSTSTEQIKFREVLGRLPEASYRMAEAQLSNSAGVAQATVRTTTTKTYIKSDNSTNALEGGSVSYPEATTLTSAITAAKTDLQIQEMQSSQQSKTITWFYPQIRDGDRVTTGLDRFSRMGTWRVRSSSWQLEYHGNNNRVGHRPLVTCDGTSLTLGLMSDRTITHREDTDIQSGPAVTEGSGQIQVSSSGGGYALGGILFNTPTRRKF